MGPGMMTTQRDVIPSPVVSIMQMGIVVKRRRLELGLGRGRLADLANDHLPEPEITSSWIRWLEERSSDTPRRPDHLRAVCRTLGLPWSRIRELAGYGDD